MTATKRTETIFIVLTFNMISRLKTISLISFESLIETILLSVIIIAIIIIAIIIIIIIIIIIAIIIIIIIIIIRSA